MVAAEGERAEAMRTREKELAAVKIAPGAASPPPQAAPARWLLRAAPGGWLVLLSSRAGPQQPTTLAAAAAGDVDIIALETEWDKKKAELALREHRGDVAACLRSVYALPAALAR